MRGVDREIVGMLTYLDGDDHVKDETVGMVLVEVHYFLKVEVECLEVLLRLVSDLIH